MSKVVLVGKVLSIQTRMVNRTDFLSVSFPCTIFSGVSNVLGYFGFWLSKGLHSGIQASFCLPGLGVLHYGGGCKEMVKASIVLVQDP